MKENARAASQVGVTANKTAQWAGYSASFFSIALFVMGTLFAESGTTTPSLLHVVTGWCMILATCSGVVCLVSAVFGLIRAR
jgi:hypothetical protein